MKLSKDQLSQLKEVVGLELLDDATEFIENLQPAAKAKTIKLKKDPSEEGYHVDEVTDSVDHKPGTYLDEETVKTLCEDKGWKVKVVRLK